MGATATGATGRSTGTRRPRRCGTTNQPPSALPGAPHTRAERLEDLVWSEAKRVLQNPALIVAGIEALEDREGGGAANSVEVDLPPDLPPVAADRQRVVQVLTNLFSNASKYSPASSTIMVTASQQDSHVAVSVADEGRGVSSEELPQLFRKFLRINGADGKTEVGGEGLGLAICKGIVETHGAGYGPRVTDWASARDSLYDPGGRRGRD